MELDFFAFRIIISISTLCLFASTLKYYNANRNLMVGLYMTYLFFFDTIQIRNCIVQFIILFATRYLFQKTRFSLLKYVLCVAIAAGFHTIAWVYLSLTLIKVFHDKKFYRSIFIIAMGLVALFIVMQPVLPQIASILSKIIKRGASYINVSIKIGWLVVLCLHILNVGALYICKDRIQDTRIKAIANNILKANIILSLFLPLTFFNNNFNRIFRNMILLTQIGFALIYNDSVRNKFRQEAFYALLLGHCGWIYSDLFVRYKISDIIKPIFENNLLLNGLTTQMAKYILITFICVIMIIIFNKCFRPQKRFIKTIRSTE